MTDQYPEFYKNIEREREFMLRLGEAITKWQMVEGACFDIYATLLKGADRHLISVTFFHIQSFESRLRLLDNCLFFMLEDDLVKNKWTPLRKRADKLRIVRNQLVHSAYIVEGKGDVQIPILGPSYSDATAVKSKRALNSEFRHDAEKVRGASQDFGKLGEELRAFREELSRIAKPVNRSPKRAENPNKG